MQFQELVPKAAETGDIEYTSCLLNTDDSNYLSKNPRVESHFASEITAFFSYFSPVIAHKARQDNSTAGDKLLQTLALESKLHDYKGHGDGGQCSLSVLVLNVSNVSLMTTEPDAGKIFSTVVHCD